VVNGCSNAIFFSFCLMVLLFLLLCAIVCAVNILVSEGSVLLSTSKYLPLKFIENSDFFYCFFFVLLWCDSMLLYIGWR
jgi:uncharacterized protein HemY